MKKDDQTLILSAVDLIGHLNCNHLTALDLAVATGSLKKPDHYDPLLDILQQRGRRHEQAYLDHLKKAGHSITIIKDIDITEGAVQTTLNAFYVDLLIPAVLFLFPLPRLFQWTA